MMSMVDPVAITLEILRIDSGCSLVKEFTKLVHMNSEGLLSKSSPNSQILSESSTNSRILQI